jgi:hypothetical protein
MTDPITNPITDPLQEAVKVSNISVVRSLDGKLSAWCDNEMILGVVNIAQQPLTDGSSLWTINLHGKSVRLAERTPAMPMYEAIDNVIQFPKIIGIRKQELPPDSA